MTAENFAVAAVKTHSAVSANVQLLESAVHEVGSAAAGVTALGVETEKLNADVSVDLLQHTHPGWCALDGSELVMRKLSPVLYHAVREDRIAR